jgi:predicted MFS family arabinose efflux permease
MAASFLAYANISVFFRFYPYLETLPIAPERFGLLIGAFSAAALAIRPLVSPRITPDNGAVCVHFGAALVIAALAAYHWAGGFWVMLAVRVLHGLAFVFMGAGLMAMIVDCIPDGRSSEAFGFLSIVIMLPNTVVPPLWPALDTLFGGFDRVLWAFAGLTVLLFPMTRLAGVRGRGDGKAPAPKLGWRDVKTDLSDHRLWGLLTAMLFLYCGVALVFFFAAGMAENRGWTGIGLFFTLTTLAEIGVRLVLGKTFDRWPKALAVAGNMAVLAAGYFLLSRTGSRAGFYALALVLGLGWGAAMPLFNGMVFDWSAARFRAFNTNLGLQTFQAGFFLGPILGGWVLSRTSFRGLYDLAAALSLAGAAILCWLGVRTIKMEARKGVEGS